jgi:hypothetical protein
MIHDYWRRPVGRVRRRRRRTTALLPAMVAILGLASAPALALPAVGGGPEVPAVRWVDCGDGFS